MDVRPGFGPFTSERMPERLALLFGLLTGVLATGVFTRKLTTAPQLDFHAYYFTGRAVLRGEAFVGTAIHDVSFLTDKEYVYTPVTAPVFAVYGLFPSWEIPYVLNAVLLLVGFYLIGRLTIQYVEARGVALARIDRWLILGFCLFSAPTVVSLYRGNVDPLMVLLVAAGFLAVERGEEVRGGVLWAVAALFKLFPAFLGVWLLYRRAWRAIGAAIVTGVGLTLLGVVVFGVDAHVAFVEFVLDERSRQGAFEGGVDPTYRWITLRRPLSQFLPLTGHQLTAVSLALATPVVALIYSRATSELDHLVAFFATVVALLVTVIPSTMGYVVYLVFPLVALLYLTEYQPAKYCFLGGLALISVPLYPQHFGRMLAAAPVSAGLERAVMGVLRNALSFGSIALWGFLLIFAGCLLVVSDPRPDSQVSPVAAAEE